MAKGAHWTVPEPVSTCEVRLDEHAVTTVRRHGNSAGPRLVLTHGNGLAVDVYYPFWSLLADDFDLMVYDLRNHGWNAVGAQRDHNVPALISDHDLILDAIVREYGEKPTVGVFHSFSTLVTLLSFNNIYSALVLFDPPLCRPAGREKEWDAAAERIAAMIRKRADRFESREQLAEILAIVPGYNRVVTGGARSHCAVDPSQERRRGGLRTPLPARLRGPDRGICEEFLAFAGPDDTDLPDEGHRGRPHAALRVPADFRPEPRSGRRLRLRARGFALPADGKAGGVRRDGPGIPGKPRNWLGRARLSA